MVNNTGSQLPLGDATVPGIHPNKEMKQAFARKLYQLTLKKGWNQSDLAREATNAAEKGVIVSRDNVSTYMRASSVPTEPKLKALAGALGIEPKDLLPNYIPAIEGPHFRGESPAFEMKDVAGSPDKAALRVNRIVSWEVATKIAALLQSDDNAANDDNKTHAKGRR